MKTLLESVHDPNFLIGEAIIIVLVSLMLVLTACGSELDCLLPSHLSP